jgi:mono/diheme cytochrome c family protein
MRKNWRQHGKQAGRFGLGAVLVAAAGLMGWTAVSSAAVEGDEPPAVANEAPKLLGAAAKRDPKAADLEERLADDIRPLLKKYCYECHANGKKKGGVTVDGPGGITDIMNQAEDWLTIVEVINLGLMPPEKKPQPTAHEKLTIQQWVEEAAEYYPADAEPDPGWYTIHRLNRSEYRNSLRDLLGIDPAEHDLAEHLPSDDTGYGFDNNADVLSMSPLQFEQYLDAAEGAVALALGSPDDRTANPLRNLERGTIGDDLDGGGQAIWANGEIFGEYDFPRDGEYELNVEAYGSKADREGPKVTLLVGDKDAGTFEITAGPRDPPQSIKAVAKVVAGKRKVTVRFINDAVIDDQDRNLFVKSVTVRGPLPSDADRRIYNEVFFIQPTADDRGRRLPDVEPGARRITEKQAAMKVIERFATRAFRRPLAGGELAMLTRLYLEARDDGDDYESAVQLVLTATLVSPHFLYRAIGNPRPNDPDFIYELDDYELASRLSYFLWSSMPDDRLLDLARARKLGDPDELRRQVDRMLKDPKADALVENFAGQWLLLRKLDGLEMDPKRYPQFNDKLREAMRTEAELFFADVLRDNRSVLTFLDSDRTYVNETLAKHYGIDGVRGDDFRPVQLPKGSPRGGVLTMAATLTVTSEATRTSPVKRGDYVLSQLMGTPPPPPPPDVPPLEQATQNVGEDATLREQLAAHVADPNCAVCHKRLDPIGLAMENFDAVGVWRDKEAGKPIDATGELPGGVRFDGPVELKRVMLGKGEQFVQNLSEKMLTYATGRGTEPFDRPTIQKITQSVEDDQYRMQSLIEAVVLSDAFRKARGRETKP